MYTHQSQILQGGVPLERADKALILIHGRGGSAQDMLNLGQQLNLEGFALLAPQATHNSWYPYSFIAPEQENQPALDSALELLSETLEIAKGAGISADHCYWLGFSQGACLTSEFVCRHARRYGGVAVLTGGVIGEELREDRYKGDFQETPILLSSGNPDPHVPVERVRESARVMKGLGAQVKTTVYEGKMHSISNEEIGLVRELFR